MKFTICGDWHLTEHRPKNRIDNYHRTQFNKIRYILKTCKKHNSIILQPGDFFDSYRVSDNLKRKYITLFKKYQIPILTIPGQHDLRHHNFDLNNTPLGVLNAANSLMVVDLIKLGSIHVYGAGWEKPIPKIENKDAFNILITHRMVINNKKLWEGQDDYTSASHLLRTTKFDLIVSGDNHNSFVYKNNNHRMVINCGSLMRSSSNQVNHKPRFYIYETATRAIEKHYIPIRNSVIKIDEIEAEKEKNERLESYIKQLSHKVEIKDLGLDYKKNLINFVKKNKIEKEVKNKINMVLE